MEDRNINNNPTGKPYCCVTGCNADAEFEIVPEQQVGEYTHACRAHVGELLCDGPVGRWEVRRLEGDS